MQDGGRQPRISRDIYAQRAAELYEFMQDGWRQPRISRDIYAQRAAELYELYVSKK